jgi:hypothetical protein
MKESIYVLVLLSLVACKSQVQKLNKPDVLAVNIDTTVSPFLFFVHLLS